MKNRVITGMLLVALSAGIAQADQVYIRNRPFKGAVTQSAGRFWLELKPLAEAFQVNVTDNGQGGYLVAAGAEPNADELSAVPPNKLKFGETLIDVQTENGVAQVPLDDFARQVNAKVIVNKQLKTVDVALAAPAQVASAAASGGALPPKPSGNVLRLYGKVGVQGANAVGLFEDGSASTPYKVGTVDSRGNYIMDIDLDKDMRHHGPASMVDMRFFRAGAFDECHGRCNFVIKRKNKLELQVYEGPKFTITGKEFEYTERD